MNAMCKCLRTYHPLFENIMRVRLALGENETAVLLGEHGEAGD
jgi:hypothetical protein